MAKQFGAELTLRDNFVEVLKRAKQATQEFKDSVTEAQKTLESIAKTKANPELKLNLNESSIRNAEEKINKFKNTEIVIKAKADSSVKTVQNELNKMSLNSREVHISAKDDVTHTVNNVQRFLFEQNGKLNASFDETFKGIGSSAENTLSKIASMSSVASVLSRTMGTTAAGGLLAPALAAGATAGSVGRFNGIIATGGTSRANENQLIQDYVKNSAWYKERYVRTPNDENGSPENEILDNKVGTGHGDIKPMWQRDSVGRLMTKTVFDDKYADKINRQREFMGAHFGNNNYLPSKRVQSVALGSGDYTQAITRDANKIEVIFDKAFRLVKSKYSSLKSFITSSNFIIGVKLLTNGIKEKLQSLWNFTSKPREFIMKAVFVGERALYHVNNFVGDVAGKLGKPFKFAINWANQHGVTAAISKVMGGIKEFSGKVFSFTVKAVTAGAEKALGGLKSAAGAIGSATKWGVVGLAGAGIAGLVSAVKGGSEQEQNQVSMQHFIGLSDPKNAATKTTDYMKQLNVMANKTPFSNQEIMDAGRRAVSVTGGDTKSAMDLTKLAGNMAALNPGKSVQDAMEALADLKTGETERMKEFGFKISADDIKKAGGVDAYFKSQTSDSGSIGKTFAGGADKLSDTTAGKWSTFTGNAQSALANIGKGLLPILNGPLDMFNQWFDKNGDKIGKWGTKIASGIKSALDSKTFKSFISIAGNVFNGLITSGGKVVNFIKSHWPQISHVFASVGKGISNVMGWVKPRLESMGKWFAEHGPAIKNIMSDAWDGIKKAIDVAWKIVGPILDSLGNVARIIADIFIAVWPGIKAAIKGIWDFCEPIFNFFSDALEKISKFSGWVADKLDGLVGKNKTVDDISKGKSGPGHAYGLRRVPYDNMQITVHEGERLLTKQEANQLDNSNGDGQHIYNIDVHVDGSKSTTEQARELVIEIKKAIENMGGMPQIA